MAPSIIFNHTNINFKYIETMSAVFYPTSKPIIRPIKELLKRQSQNKFLTFEEKERIKKYESNKRKQNKAKPKYK